MTDDARGKWSPIAPLPYINGAVEPILKTADVLRSAWEDALQSFSSKEFSEAQSRRLRRHAVETGIIERLYDLDWGTTEALVAEGLTMDAANQANGISEENLVVIRSQYDALEFLVDLVNKGRPLSVQVIRELHSIIARHQHTYEARNQFGNIVQAQLRRGDWKTQANHVRRPDGSVLEYCPPEHVQAEMEQLIALYQSYTDRHPIIVSAWLHHRFIQIHPFEDGNGRVARALTLLVLLKDRYAPLVVDRRQRGAYISALDAANDGDLADLIRFFARLEIAALQSTLTQPIPRAVEADAVGVVRAYAKRLQEIQKATSVEKSQGVQRVAEEGIARIVAWLDQQRSELQDSFREVDPSAWASVSSAKPPEEKSGWWKRQIIYAAKAVDFYANLSGGAWWATLRVEALGERLRFLAAIQKVGHGDSGLLALTVYAELVHPGPDESSTASGPEPALELSPTDSVTLSYSEDITERWQEMEDLLRQKLREATINFVERLG
ncbi:Fic family protein [Actinomadura viridis]|uniref:Fic family protein n=1 Tax=Actinomadura viridis TaxID=58110 RepID=UPI0036A9D74E